MSLVEYLQRKPSSRRAMLSPVQRSTALTFLNGPRYGGSAPSHNAAQKQAATKSLLQSIADGVGGKDGSYNNRTYKAKTTYTLNTDGKVWNPSDYSVTQRTTKATSQGEVQRNYSWNKPGTKTQTEKPEADKNKQPDLRDRISQKTPDIIENNASVKAKLYQVEGTAWDASAVNWDPLAKNENHSLSVRAIGSEAKGSAQAEVDLKNGKFEVGANGSVSAYLLNAEYRYENGPVSAGASVFVGAEADAQVNAYLDWRKGTVGAEMGGEAFAGGKIEGDVALGRDGVGTAKVNGGVTYGIGAEFSAEMKFDGGKVKVDYDIGATLGLGVDLGFEAEIDIQGMATSAFNNDTVRNVAGKTATEVKDFGEGAIDVAQSAGGFVKKLWGG